MTKKKKKIGRPAADVQRDFRLTIRLTRDEANRLAEQANRDHLSVTSWTRRVILSMLEGGS